MLQVGFGFGFGSSSGHFFSSGSGSGSGHFKSSGSGSGSGSGRGRFGFAITILSPEIAQSTLQTSFSKSKFLRIFPQKHHFVSLVFSRNSKNRCASLFQCLNLPFMSHVNDSVSQSSPQSKAFM